MGPKVIVIWRGIVAGLTKKVNFNNFPQTFVLLKLRYAHECVITPTIRI